MHCFRANTDHSKLFLRDLSRIVLQTPIQLAVVDDEYHGADLYFRVLLTREGKESQVEYFANWGHDAEKYGYAYQAPQKLIEARHMALWGNWKRPKLSNKRRVDAPKFDPKASGER